MLEGVSRRRLRETLTGAELATTRRHGKHLFVRAGDDGWLVLHFGMTGQLEHIGSDDEIPEHTRFALRFDDRSVLALDDQRRLGHVSLTDTIEEYVAANDLGEDALRLPESALRAALSARRGGLKAALMDQALMAGIGNVYSDEILFQARLHPRVRPPDLDPSAGHRLHRQIRRVLTIAADRGADPGRVPRGWLLRHREDGARCPRGNGRIEKYRISGRGGFLCSGCQPDGPAA